jgi:PQQ-dependent catabolism-associated CXXCW motif protein
MLLALSFLTVVASVNAGEPSEHFDPVTGYRIARYQAAVPETPPAGARVWIDDIDRLIANERAVLLDVSPIHGAGFDSASGAWRLSKPHETLPGAVWLPEVGRGAIEPVMERFLASNLARLTGGDTSRAVVIFCNADCWMSWNAMKRAASLGYTNLKWFPEGIDGWRDFDRVLVPAVPVAVEASE